MINRSGSASCSESTPPPHFAVSDLNATKRHTTTLLESPLYRPSFGKTCSHESHLGHWSIASMETCTGRVYMGSPRRRLTSPRWFHSRSGEGRRLRFLVTIPSGFPLGTISPQLHAYQWLADLRSDAPGRSAKELAGKGRNGRNLFTWTLMAKHVRKLDRDEW